MRLKLQAIASRNRLKSVAKQRESQQQQLRALVKERRAELERLTHFQFSLLRTDHFKVLPQYVSIVNSVMIFPLLQCRPIGLCFSVLSVLACLSLGFYCVNAVGSTHFPRFQHSNAFYLLYLVISSLIIRRSSSRHRFITPRHSSLRHFIHHSSLVSDEPRPLRKL